MVGAVTNAYFWVAKKSVQYFNGHISWQFFVDIDYSVDAQNLGH